jgi:hypothetical protein
MQGAEFEIMPNPELGAHLKVASLMLNTEDMVSMFSTNTTTTHLRVPVVNTQKLQVQFNKGKQWAYVVRLPNQGNVRNVSATAGSSVNSTEEQRSNYHTPRETEVQRALNKLNLKKSDYPISQWEKIHDLVRDSLAAFPLDSTKPGITKKVPAMEIETDGKPFKGKPYKTTPEDRHFLQETIQRLMESGVIRPANSPWAFPVLIARHKSGKLRMCVNFKKLNLQSKLDSYPLPNINELLNSMGGKAYYSTLDLAQGFHQTPVSDVKDKDGHTAQDKATMTTPFGTYSWESVPFGLCNAPPHFSRIMDMVLNGLYWSVCSIFIDDICIFSTDLDTHVKDLGTVFNRLMDYGLSIKPEKCQLFLKKVQYLGHILSEDGIEPIKARVEAIEKIARPKTLTELRSFTAMCQYYRRFIKDFSIIAAPLFALTKKENLPFKAWAVGSPADKAFRELKNRLCSAPVLKLPDMTKHFYLFVDASKEGYGAVLEQDFTDADGKVRRHPVYYASRRTSPAEKKYKASTHREASAVVWALHHYRFFIQGLPTTVYTDHGPLTWLMKTEFLDSPLAKYAARMQPWNKNVEVKYKPGRLHANADGPSRLPVDMEFDGIDPDDVLVPDSYVGSIRKYVHNLNRFNDDPTKAPWEQSFERSIWNSDFVMRVQRGQRTESFSKKAIAFLSGETTDVLSPVELDELKTSTKDLKLKDGLLYRITEMRRSPQFPKEKVAQLYLPRSCRKEILQALHEHPTSSHVGVNKMFRLIQCRYYWPRYQEEIAEWIETCPLCQRYKPTKPTRNGLLHPKRMEGPMSTLNIDIISGFVPYRGYTKILTCIDTFTRWLYLIPVKSTTAKEIADAIYENVVMEHGCVPRILSDNGPEFANQVMGRMCTRMGIKQAHSTAYHPQTNAQVERIHRHLAKSLAILSHEYKNSWYLHVKEVQFAYRMSPIDALGMSPFEMLYGRAPRLPVDILTSDEFELKTDAERYQLDFPKRMAEIWRLVKKQSEDNADKNKKIHDKDKKSVEFEVGQKVLVYRPWVDEDIKPGKLHTRWRGPFEVVKRGKYSDRTYHLRNDDGEEFTVDVNDMVRFRDTRKPNFDDTDSSCFAHEKPEPEAVGEDLEEGGNLSKEDFYSQTRAVQKEILQEVIDTLNACNSRMEVVKSTIEGMDRRYPYGVITKKAMLAQEVLGEYKGANITKVELDVKYPNDDARYAFELEDGTFVDADDPTSGNIMRFINGTGDDDKPNVQVFEVKGRLTLITTREIAPGEELMFDYGREYHWEHGERKSLNSRNQRTSTQQPAVPEEAKDNHETKSPPLTRQTGQMMRRFLPTTFVLDDLEMDSCIVYEDNQSGDVPEGWSIARVTGVFYDEGLIECHRLGSLLYSKSPAKVADAVWKARWRDPKDGKDAITETPTLRLKPFAVVEWVKPSQLIAHGFFLTNRGKVEQTVLELIRRYSHGT